MEKDYENNAPGICLVEYISTDQVSSVSSPTDHKVTVSLFPTGAWLDIDFTDLSAKFDQVKKIDTAGPFFELKLTVRVPKSRPEIAAILENLDNRLLMLRVTDKNDQVLILGEPDYPVVMADSLSIPAKGYNGWEFVFTGKSTHRAYYQA